MLSNAAKCLLRLKTIQTAPASTFNCFKPLLPTDEIAIYNEMSELLRNRERRNYEFNLAENERELQRKSTLTNPLRRSQLLLLISEQKIVQFSHRYVKLNIQKLTEQLYLDPKLNTQPPIVEQRNQGKQPKGVKSSAQKELAKPDIV